MAEKQRYLRPGRDLFWNLAEVEELMGKGLRLILFGRDVATLWERLNRPEKHAKNKRRLQIYLVGLFPLIDQRSEIISDVLTLSIEEEPSLFRVVTDGYEFAKLRDRFAGDLGNTRDVKHFLVSFAAPMPAFRGNRRRSTWHKASRCPESSIDLRVYVPSYTDRKYDNVRMPLGDLCRMSTGSRVHRTLQPGLVAAKALLGTIDRRDVGCFAVSGSIHGGVPPAKSLLLVLFPFHTYMELWF